MTYLTATQSFRTQDSPLNMLASFFESRKLKAARRQTVRALSCLDNRALKDLAISKSEIYSVAYNPSGGRKRGFAG